MCYHYIYETQVNVNLFIQISVYIKVLASACNVCRERYLRSSNSLKIMRGRERGRERERERERENNK